jgi:hypothetical protein
MITTTVQLSANEPNKNELEQIAIQNLIRDSLTQKIDSRRKQKTNEELQEALIAVLQEFTKCFFFVGFDFNHDPVILSRANTPLEGEALVSLVKKVFADVSKR